MPKNTTDEVINSSDHAAIFDLSKNHSVKSFKKYVPSSIDQRIKAGKNAIILNAQRLDFSKKYRAYDLTQTRLVIDSENPIDVDSHLYSRYNHATDLDTVDEETIIEKRGTGVLTLNSNSSWFNGRVNLREGNLVVPATASIFGGAVSAYPGTEIVWHVAEKDPSNTPSIDLHNATLKMYGDAPGISSVYFELLGDEDSVLEIVTGNIHIKNDCSGFKGNIILHNGANIVIRQDQGSSGEHRGKMPEGDFYIKDRGTAIIDTSDGLKPMNLREGHLVINNKLGKQTKIKKTVVDRGAKITVNVDDPILKDMTVHGELDLAGNGETVVLKNMNIDGGILKASGPNISNLQFEGPLKIGSGLNLMGNKVVDTIDMRNAQPSIYESRNFELWIDIDPAKNAIDNIIAQNITFFEGSALEIKDFELLSAPTEEVHVFRVLTLTDENAKYLPIVIGTNKEFDGAYGKYRLYAEGGDGFVTLRIANPKNPTPKIAQTPNSTEGLQPVQLAEINTAYSPMKLMHLAMLSNTTSIYNTVCNNFSFEKPEDIGEKYRFWNKNFSNSLDVKTTANNVQKLHSNLKGTIIGFDGKASKLKNGGFFMPTVFGSYSRAKLKNNYQRSSANDYIIGTKLSWFGDKNRLDLIGSYCYTKTGNNLLDYGKHSLKTNTFSIGSKFSHSIKLTNHMSLIPSILPSYSFIKTGKVKLDKSIIATKGYSTLNVSPGIELQIKNSQFGVSIGSKINKRVCGTMKSYADGSNIHSLQSKKTNVEYELNLFKNIKDKGEINIGITKTTCGSKGITVKLGVSAKL
ncbi:hypothetical protein FACS1894113_4170 [Alphaproteobacteria bacterium]|nr:hypothetical protein FACS1894113_4170 [Alphaproteobacteria bacterium]